MEITEINNYEIGNGIKAKVKIDGQQFTAYLQLPNCPDSKHCFIDEKPAGNTDRILAEIVEQIKKTHTNIELICLTEFGHTDYSYDTCMHEGMEYYVFTDLSGDDDHHFMKKSNYSDYYNTLLLSQLNEEKFNEELMEKLRSLI